MTTVTYLVALVARTALCPARHGAVAGLPDQDAPAAVSPLISARKIGGNVMPQPSQPEETWTETGRRGPRPPGVRAGARHLAVRAVGGATT
ncbi:hypothetical protein AB0D49_39195 [Streptomyces sp. NPDC048290]|uniref:hypothetical protein n=1 Tax=Streptomyces sp. NPDC048290 TaxID=3155811 RepID=UPI0034344BBB